MAADDVEITLTSADNTEHKVPLKCMTLSVLVQSMVEEDGGQPRVDEAVPLPNVKSDTLNLVIEYCKHYYEDPQKEIPKPIASNVLEDIVDEWYGNFVNVSDDVLFQLIMAANYLDIKPLLDLACAKIATMVKGKTPEEIRRLFRIQNDFTPEQEAQVRAENKWCEEA